uniref:Uncharacterized protein n=1 Tax=viral metagenome TaxID=1070528 RepID=A0A6M3L601_9ZZZZ
MRALASYIGKKGYPFNFSSPFVNRGEPIVFPDKGPVEVSELDAAYLAKYPTTFRIQYGVIEKVGADKYQEVLVERSPMVDPETLRRHEMAIAMEERAKKGIKDRRDDAVEGEGGKTTKRKEPTIEEDQEALRRQIEARNTNKKEAQAKKGLKFDVQEG